MQKSLPGTPGVVPVIDFIRKPEHLTLRQLSRYLKIGRHVLRKLEKNKLIKPLGLTLIYGQNSSGKSSVLQLLKLINLSLVNHKDMFSDILKFRDSEKKFDLSKRVEDISLQQLLEIFREINF